MDFLDTMSCSGVLCLLGTHKMLLTRSEMSPEVGNGITYLLNTSVLLYLSG